MTEDEDEELGDEIIPQIDTEPTQIDDDGRQWYYDDQERYWWRIDSQDEWQLLESEVSTTERIDE